MTAIAERNETTKDIQFYNLVLVKNDIIEIVKIMKVWPSIKNILQMLTRTQSISKKMHGRTAWCTVHVN